MRKILLFCLILSGLQADKLPKNYQNSIEFQNFAARLFEVHQKIQSLYPGNFDSQKAFEGAINGMVTSVDSYSSYFSESAYEEMLANTKGEYLGIGVHILLENHTLKITSVMDGSPAAQVGLKNGDLIYRIDSNDLHDWSFEKIKETLRGVDGSKMNLAVLRAGVPMEFEILRSNIKIKPTQLQLLPSNVAYIKINHFSLSYLYFLNYVN